VTIDYLKYPEPMSTRQAMLDRVIRHATAIGTHARRMTEESDPAIRYWPTRHEQQRALVLPPGPAIPGIGLVLLVARSGPAN